MSSKAWTKEENRLVVAGYFEMLEAELCGIPFNKADRLRSLGQRLSSRSVKAPEFKHQNISAILVDLGLPYIDGYKPLSNYQNLLAKEVNVFLEQDSTFLDRVKDSLLINPELSKVTVGSDLSKVVESPPLPNTSSQLQQKPWLARKTQKIDFVERDANNRRLGNLGEQFVFDFERNRLALAGRDDLAKKVTWLSRDLGDGLGFDILSFDGSDESEQMIEVKTTGLGKYFPFYVTLNELRCSEDIPNQFSLYRVFSMSRSPRVYILRGDLGKTCDLTPVLYKATTQ